MSIAFIAVLLADVSLNVKLVIRLKHSEEVRTAFGNYRVFNAGGKGVFCFQIYTSAVLLHALYNPQGTPTGSPDPTFEH